MTISNQQLFNPSGLRALIAKLIGIDAGLVIPSNSQIDTTNIAFYVTVHLTTSTPQGTSIQYDGATETEYAEVKSNALYSIQLIGKNAKLWAERLHPSLRLTSSVNELKLLGIGILQISALRDTSIALDAGFEERAQFDLLVSQTVIVKEQLNQATSVEIEGQFE